MQTQREPEKPATVRIENLKMEHGMSVPIPGPGRSIAGYVKIPARGEKTEFGPGVIETDELDAVTLNRLRYHYEWRPTDPKNMSKKREELLPDQVTEIGLLRITVVPEGGKGKKTEPKAA